MKNASLGISPAAIRLATAERKLRDADARIRHLEGELARSHERTERVREAKLPKIKAHKPRARLRGDTTRVILCDLHGAKMAQSAAEAALGLIEKMQPDGVFLLGDMVDCGGFLAQHHVWGYVAEASYTYEQDIAAAAAFLARLRGIAANATIEYVEGNHEQRVEKWCVTQALRNQRDADYLMRQFAPQHLLKLRDLGINHYRMGQCYDELTLPGTIKRGSCYFTHGSFLTSKNAASDAVSRLAGNIWFGNTHRADVYIGRRTNVGVVGAWNPGCLCELQPLWQNTNPTDWTHGLGIQFQSRTGKFLNLIVPIIDGECLLEAVLSHHDTPRKNSEAA